ncbi:MAG: hypothetical protein CFE45_25020 [Burkholderiales bacterium PBB5]|nr:MAG: hypothetical protein CFE45_25020 [Burkholderiales bacterium PBB5]
MLCSIAALAEARDADTGHHIQRTRSYVELLARELQRSPAHAADLAEAQLQRIVDAAPLHDLGKIGIPDQILLKPGRLTPDEFEVMKTHARIGGDAIARALATARARHASGGAQVEPESVRLLEVARDIAHCHHEHWNGCGYPDGLQGNAIPLSARLMAVADVFDALTTPRPYKTAWPIERAVDYITQGSGKQFDPAVVTALLACRERFEAVALQWMD